MLKDWWKNKFPVPLCVNDDKDIRCCMTFRNLLLLVLRGLVLLFPVTTSNQTATLSSISPFSRHRPTFAPFFVLSFTYVEGEKVCFMIWRIIELCMCNVVGDTLHLPSDDG